MIKILRHGALIVVSNPVDGSEQTLRNIVFVEEGRAGADRTLSDSNAFLNKLMGKQVGLSQLRTHTQPVLVSEVGAFVVGREFQGHINREMHSTPQMRQQEDVGARLIDGKPTYFKTWLDGTMKDDVDYRMSNETLVSIAPQFLLRARIGGAIVKTIEPDTSRIFPASEQLETVGGAAGTGEGLGL